MTGFLPRRPAPPKYKKMIDNLAAAITSPPFNLSRGANYLRSWNAGTLSMTQPLDCLELKSSSTAAPSTRPAAARAAMSFEPEQSEVRVSSGNDMEAEPSNMKMMVINEMASALHNNGSTWVHAIRESYRMFEQLPVQLQAKLGSQATMSCDEEKDDADVPLEAELDRDV